MPHDIPALIDIAAERKRQIDAEGWTPEHDDTHVDGELADAASCYAMSARAVALYHSDLVRSQPWLPRWWPFSSLWWKPKDRRSDLVRAAALLVAEIERLDRRAARVGGV